jgi:hypothetical protein
LPPVQGIYLVTMYTILCPTDFSAGAQRAAEFSVPNNRC